MPEGDGGEMDAEFRALHARVYEVYRLPADRDAVWELLASCFAGEALTTEYIEHWTTKARMVDEETAIDIRRVDHDSVEVLERDEDHARVDVAWSVGGVVTHRRHKHPRVNRYQAVYSLANGADGWRIVATRVRNVQRVQSPSRTRGVFDIVDEPDRGGYLDPLDLLDAGIGGGQDTASPTPDTDVPP
jgi:hypothetical protein